MSTTVPPDEFDTHWERLGLDSVKDQRTLEGTLTPGDLGETLLNPLLADLPTERGTVGTLPELTLAPPPQAHAGPSSDPDLVPISLLGEGGMGQVFVARQSALDREVAVKLLKEGAQKGASALVHEARITGGLEHPNIIPVYALGSSGGGLPAVVMKRVDGVSWRELLQNANHPAWQRVLRGSSDRLEANLRLLMQVCDALAYAHRREVVHRDLKPANVLVGELGEVYLADWGVAMRKLPPDAPAARPQLVGTPAYMAPEMVAGDPRRIDERTDVYLLGATLHELLVGRPPHLGDDLKDTLQRAAASAPAAYGADVPEELAGVARRAMDPDPARRFPSAEEFREAITRFLAHRGSAELARAARERLDELRGCLQAPGESKGAWALFAECRFGFSQALKAWPDNTAAYDGLAEALEVMARLELAQGNLSGARALVAELARPSPGLLAEVRALEERLERARRREGMLEQFQKDLDLSVAAGQRRRWLLVLAGVAALFGVLLAAFRPLRSEDQRQPWVMLASVTVVALVMSGGFFLQRRTLLSNTANRRLAAFILVTVWSLVVHRALGAAMDSPAAVTAVGDSLVGAAMAGLAAATLHWRLRWSSFAFLGAAVISVVFPLLSTALFAGAVSAALALVATVMNSPGKGIVDDEGPQ